MRKIITAFMLLLCAVCMASAANYLTFTAEEDGSTFSFVNNKDNNPDVQYSLDGGETWAALAGGDTVTLAHKGDKALLKGDNPKGFSKDRRQYSAFKMTGKVAASGSVMSLIDGVGLFTKILSDNCFYELFYKCTSLTQAPALPATTLVKGCYCGMFLGCTSLTQAPELPATTLSNWCYESMFSGCTSLTQAPELPATTLAGYCYESMFSGCTSLTQAPALPATTLAEWCYFGMFSGCTSLTQAPALPATTLANYCYYSMFSGCTSLTQAPELPATTLAKYCYQSMFSGCTSLTQAPELPATTLAGYCYESMFSGCTSLTQAPALPATTLAIDCYEDMFSGCINLSELNVSFDDWKSGNIYSCSGWVKDVAPTGTFICPKNLIPAYGISRIPIGWTAKSIVDGDTVDVPINYNYLTFTAEEDGSTFGIETKKYRHSSIVSTLVYPSVQYSLDGGVTWTALVEGDTILLAHKGDKALLRGDNPNGFSESSSYSTFKMTGKVAASGSVMSLIDGIGCSVKIPQFCCFSGLFENCTSLTQAPALPATTLSDECYAEMFSGCTSLTQAPELPATTLSYECYSFMFSGCTSLTQAPALPATTLADACYNGMFKGCTGLTQAPELPATTLARYCYFYMFEKCTSLTQAPELPATTLAGYCYESMFSGCTSLTQAPALPATTMATNCYENMFYGCTNLSELNVSFDDWKSGNVRYSCSGWVKDVAPTGTFICPKDLPLEYGVDRIPEGWTVKYIDGTVAVETNYLTFTAEEDGSTFGIAYNYLSPDVQYSLNGGETWTELAVGDTILLAKKGDKALIRGYNGGGLGSNKEDYVHFVMTGAIAASGSVMSLIDGVGLSTEISESFCFYRLFSGCTSLTQAPELPAKTLAYYCYDSMFSGCTSLTQAPELPATEMSFYCYNSMFSGCTSLTQAPELPATTLFENCYSGMFSGCTSLSEINVSFDDWDKLDATFEWVANVAPTGTFYCPKALPLEYGVDRIPEGWTVKYINYLTFTAEEDGSTFGIVNNGGNNPDIQYSLDGGETWTALAAGDTIMLAHKGDKALLRGDNPEGFSKVDIKYSSFTMTGKIAVSGSVMSLIDGTGVTLVVPAGYCFYSLFKGCTSLTQAPELPATRLADGCYYGMFQGCTSLTQAPELPATTLDDSCYRNMFLGCTSLTQAPELSATTLDDHCYECMFRGCTSLTQAPKLPATTLGWGCYDSMFKGCTSLTQAPALPATTLTYTCYYGMFSGCTSLTQAPELPATTLVSSCYAGMLSGCTSLTQAPKLPATELADFGYFEMFSGCTSLTQAPELPATTLTDECYDRMFFDCTSLSEINVSFATWSVYYRSTAEWVKDVAPTGTFICPKALYLEYGVSRIPEGWTVKYADEGSGVSSALADGVTVWTDDLTVYVRGAEGKVSLYDMSGRIVAVSNSADEERALSVPAKGVYVVWTSGGERSVLVR